MYTKYEHCSPKNLSVMSLTSKVDARENVNRLKGRKSGFYLRPSGPCKRRCDKKRLGGP